MFAFFVVMFELEKNDDLCYNMSVKGVLVMFYTNEAINSLFEYSKRFVDQINNTRNIRCPKELKEIQYLIFAGMVSYYGFEHIQEIYDSFQKTGFHYSKDSVYDLLSKFDKNTAEKFKNDPSSIPKAFLNRTTYLDNFSRYHIQRDVYISDNGDEEYIDLLEYTIHELNHVVNSIKYPICVRDSKKVSRVGLAIVYSEGSEALSLEESINVLQTTDILLHILNFTQYDVQDQEIKYALDRIKHHYGKERKSTGYEYTVPIVKPLYENKDFNHLLKEKRISADIKYIREEFDSKTKPGSFYKLASKFDEIYSLNYLPLILDRIDESEEIVKQYLKK